MDSFSAGENRMDSSAPNFDMGVVERVALDRFGIKSLKMEQRSVIEGLLFGCGRTLAIMATGMGKTLCFQLASLFTPGITIVCYPLLSLMSDQERRAEKAGIVCAVLRGGQTKEEREAIFCSLRTGKAKMIIANPEILSSSSVLEELTKLKVGLFVLDEAHTAPEWGDSFRPAFLALKEFVNRVRPEKVALFTATSSPENSSRLAEIMFSGQKYETFRFSGNRANITYRSVPSISPNRSIIGIVKACQKPALVFAPTRHQAEAIAARLQTNMPSVPVRYYHAGLDKATRKSIEEWYFHSKDGVLCSTSAFGMGVDKGDINTVVHMSLPHGVSSFLQESGRAGRAGQEATSYIVFNPYEKVEDPEQKEILSIMLAKRGCIRQALLKKMGEDFPPEQPNSPARHKEKCCSVCSGVAERFMPPAGERIILKALSSEGYWNSIAELALTLTASPYCPIGRTSAFWGRLKPWQTQHCEEAIRILIGSGKIRISESGKLWRETRKKPNAPSRKGILERIVDFFF